MKLEYDIQKRARAGTAATFRAVVAGYIAYLGWKVATAEGGSMPPLAARLKYPVSSHGSITFLT